MAAKLQPCSPTTTITLATVREMVSKVQALPNGGPVVAALILAALDDLEGSDEPPMDLLRKALALVLADVQQLILQLAQADKAVN